MPSPTPAAHCPLHGAICRVRTHEAWPEPENGSKEEAVKAALKTHRDLSRIRINDRATSATGVELSRWIVWLFDVWRQADYLPVVQRDIVRLYFLSEGADGLQRTNMEIARALGMGERTVKELKRQAVDNICAAIWPEEIGA